MDAYKNFSKNKTKMSMNLCTCAYLYIFLSVLLSKSILFKIYWTYNSPAGPIFNTHLITIPHGHQKNSTTQLPWNPLQNNPPSVTTPPQTHQKKPPCFPASPIISPNAASLISLLLSSSPFAAHGGASFTPLLSLHSSPSTLSSITKLILLSTQ